MIYKHRGETIEIGIGDGNLDMKSLSSFNEWMPSKQLKQQLDGKITETATRTISAMLLMNTGN